MRVQMYRFKNSWVPGIMHIFENRDYETLESWVNKLADSLGDAGVKGQYPDAVAQLILDLKVDLASHYGNQPVNRSGGSHDVY